jgi:hypothetical protein
MQKKTTGNNWEPETGSEGNKPLSETISNAHSSGNGSLRLSEDGLVFPDDITPDEAAAEKKETGESQEY